MIYSLIPNGLDPTDDEYLRFFFENREEPANHIERVHWERTRKIVDECNWFDFQSGISNFYRSGLFSFAHGSATAKRDYDEKYPSEPRPVGGVRLQEWIEYERHKPSLNQWLCGLYQRERDGKTTGQDRMTLAAIRLDCSVQLENLVGDYKRRKASVLDYEKRQEERKRREVREAREELDRTRNAAGLPPASKKKENRRKWGELPPEPEIIRRRR